MKFNEKGQELPDPAPLAIPLGAKKPETLVEMMRRLIRQDLSRHAQEEGNETFEEANDFDIEEDDAELHTTEYEEMREEIPVAQAESKESHSERGSEAETSEGEDGEEDAEPARRRRAHRRRRPETQVDLEDDDGGPDEPDEEAPPVTRRARPPVSKRDTRSKPSRGSKETRR